MEQRQAAGGDRRSAYDLERLHEALGPRVVARIAAPAHGAGEAVFVDERPVLRGCVSRAAVRVADAARQRTAQGPSGQCGASPAGQWRTLESGDGQACVDPAAMAQPTARRRPGIQDGRHVDEAGGDGDEGDVARHCARTNGAHGSSRSRSGPCVSKPPTIDGWIGPSWSPSVVLVKRRRRRGSRSCGLVGRRTFLAFTTRPRWRGSAPTRRQPWHSQASVIARISSTSAASASVASGTARQLDRAAPIGPPPPFDGDAAGPAITDAGALVGEGPSETPL